MLDIPQIKKSLKEVLAGPPMPTEQRLEYEQMWPTLLILQEHPDIALTRLTGIFMPPHQRTMLYAQQLGALQNIFVCSRGTAKSTTVCGLAAVHQAWLYPNRDGVLLHGGGFRGGQMLFNEMQRWIEGGWDDQEKGLKWLSDSSKNPKIITRQASYWELPFKSDSKYTVLPTNDPDRILGVRAKMLFVDEANTADPQMIEKTALPFLNVKGDMRHGGAYAASNSVSFTTTIDFSFRPFQRYVRAAAAALETDFAAALAAEQGNIAKYRDIAKDGLAQYTYVRFDYTDMMIRRRLTDRNGMQYEVTWPNKDIPLKHLPHGIPFTERGEDGQVKKDGSPVDVYITYPIDFKQIERPLRDGSADETTWKAEQRNIEDSAQGDVYSHGLIDAASCVGDRWIISWDRLSDEWKRKYPDESVHFTPPIMYRCSDPCVIGIDYAGGDRDFTAYTVIRLGPLAKDDFNPMTGQGRTPWSNVIWCEQHHYSSHEDVREKVWQLMERYNVVYFHDPYEKDDWKACRGIGLDMRGGGQGARDTLVYLNHDVPHGRFRIYDPLDLDARIVAYATDPNSRPILDGISANDTTNERLVEFTKGQMEAGQLYIPKYLQPSERGPDRSLDPAYEASKLLSQQLRKLQQELTARARKFSMPGNKDGVEGKKDLWSSFIYAAKQMRAHMIRFQAIVDTPPPTGGVISRIGSARRQRGINGPAIGTRRSY
jgi:hypothetical protein